MAAPKPIVSLGLDHVVLRVRDLERSLHFYTEVLDGDVERELTELGLIQVRLGAHLIDFVPIDKPLGARGGAPPGDEGRNVDHFCVRVELLDEKIVGYLRKHGIESTPIAELYGAEGVGPSIYVRDPDNNVVELKGPPS